MCLSTGSSITSETESLFNDKCYLCKKGRVQYKNKERFPVTLETDEAVETFLAAVKAKDPAVYRELQQLDLHVRKFKLHKHCHRNFTRGFTKSSRENPRNEENGSSIVAFF